LFWGVVDQVSGWIVNWPDVGKVHGFFWWMVFCRHKKSLASFPARDFPFPMN
jgi:hypothetical protein